ncbi:clindamycin resistance transfer factor BtgB [Parabacteroides distasonis]|uniref:DUF5712 family protein n=1 Tax=Parabacteroides distasonis TaxID=823 RepID=UPI001BDF4196|nr:DUF5712 family protein [Parabacteroides distasonis]MBT1281310.1 clindamycin resistance transfer factor BtgB [Parabacteroides distasonis]
MHIDFAPPSNGTYNNAGSSRQLANYCEHEDLKRIEKGIYTEGFFNLTDDNIYKSKVIKDIDSNIGQLLKIDAKFYAIHVSPSEKELRAMGNTEQEQVEAMKRYIREVFIPEYAKNFNKGLSEADIKFYGKIHFDRSRSDNELNMHCHLIVSRKDQSNKKKLSPLTNHKNTKKGTVTGGFDRVNLFQRAEQGFNKLFGYNRPLAETFQYCNTIKNGSMSNKLKIQEKEIFSANEKEHENMELQKSTVTKVDSNISVQQINTTADKQNNNDSTSSANKSTIQNRLSSLFSILPLATDISLDDNLQQPNLKKKKKPRLKL